MSYNLSHLQQTVHYIVEKLQFNDPRKGHQNLTSSVKDWISLELLAAIDPLQVRNPKNIAINPSNKYLKEFFDLLQDRNIIFPESTTYLLKRTGVSYELHDGNRVEIYNRKKLRDKVASRRIAELEEQLSLMSMNDDEQDDHYDMLSDNESQQYTPHFATLNDYLTEPHTANDLRMGTGARAKL